MFGRTDTTRPLERVYLTPVNRSIELLKEVTMVNYRYIYLSLPMIPLNDVRRWDTTSIKGEVEFV